MAPLSRRARRPNPAGARQWLDRHQIGLYLAAIASGFLIGAVLPAWTALEPAITPAIGLLLYATFLGVPLARLATALRDGRFLLPLLLLNFVLAPAVAFGLSRFVASEPALLIGVLLVLLTPCIDYVIVFSGLAGAAHEKLLAASPLLLVLQFLLLPAYLYLFAGPATLGVIEARPFAEAFLTLILLPLAAAGATQALAARLAPARAFAEAAGASMVPLMVLVLFTVTASQAPRILAGGSALLALPLLYAAFLLVMTGIGILLSRAARMDSGRARALTFSGATRNSLVVLPLALALPHTLELAAAAVVTQTLVELAGMVLLVRFLPRLLPGNQSGRGRVLPNGTAASTTPPAQAGPASPKESP